MRCPKCGGYSFDSEDRCLNCGHVISSDAKPPPWWGAQASLKSSMTSASKEETANAYSARLTICPKCRERSLFYNEKEKVYECLNRRCKAKSRPPDKIKSAPQVLRQRSPAKHAIPSHVRTSQTSTMRKTAAPTLSTNVASVWFASAASKLSFWWKWHEPHRFRITKRGLSAAWGFTKKTLIFFALLVITASIITSVSQVISGKITVASGFIIATSSLILGIWSSNSLSFYKVTFTRFFMIVVISTIFIMVSNAYMDITTISDVKQSITDALSITKIK